MPLKLLKGQKVKSKVLGDVHKGRVDLRMKLTQRKAEPRAGKRNSQLHCDPATPQPGLFLGDFLSTTTINSCLFVFLKPISGDFVSHVVNPGVLPNGSPLLGMSIQAPTHPPGLKLCLLSPLHRMGLCRSYTPHSRTEQTGSAIKAATGTTPSNQILSQD